MLENEEYTCMTEKKDDAAKCITTSEPTTTLAIIRSILKSKPKDIPIDAGLSTSLQTLQAWIDLGKFSLEVKVYLLCSIHDLFH